jgi:hypothetical protein
MELVNQALDNNAKLINQSHHDKLASNFKLILTLLGLGFVFIAGSYYKSIYSQEIILTKISEQSQLSNLVHEIQANILETNREKTSFSLTDLTAFSDKISKTKKNLFEIKELMRSEDDKQFSKTVDDLIDKYQYNFSAATKASLELGTNEESGLVNQFNSKMKDISDIANKAKDEKLMEKFLLLRNLQENYLNPKNNTTVTAEQVIVAQKNFLDRVNRSTGDYAHVSKMMVQTISLMQSFDLLKIFLEQKNSSLKKAESYKLELQTSLKRLSEITDDYKTEDQELVSQTEQLNFALFFISSALMSMVFVIAILL